MGFEGVWRHTYKLNIPLPSVLLPESKVAGIRAVVLSLIYTPVYSVGKLGRWQLGLFLLQKVLPVMWV